MNFDSGASELCDLLERHLKMILHEMFESIHVK